MDFKNIVEKWNYDEEFSKFLKEVYYALIERFGDVKLVYDAFYNTEISSVKNVYHALHARGMLDSGDFIVQDDDLKRSSGVNHSIERITYNSETKEFEIFDIRRCVMVVDMDLTSTSKKATLIHELCHMVKSYHNEYEIVGNRLYYHSGLITSEYELSFDGEKVNKRLISEKGVGLEEGLTSVDETIITRKLIDPKYVSSGYGVVNQISKNMLIIPGVAEIIRTVEIYHDKSELINLIGQENYEKLENIADRIYALNLELFASAMDFDKLEAKKEELLGVIHNEYIPLQTSLMEGKRQL